MDYGINGQYVIRAADQAARFRGHPAAVKTDNGPEFTGRAFIGWAQSHGIRHPLIEPGRPMQNGYIESLNGRFREECLTSTGSRRCIRPAKRSRRGGSTTTRCGPTGASGACPQLGSPNSIAVMPAMRLISSAPQTTRSSNLQSGLLQITGTANGCRSLLLHQVRMAGRVQVKIGSGPIGGEEKRVN